MADPLISNDSDAPEEVTLHQGREEAKTSRRKETENKKRLGTELKEERKAREEKRKKERRLDVDQDTDSKGDSEIVTLPEKKRSRTRKGKQSDGASSGEESNGQDLSSVMLDDSVVEFLKASEKQVGKGVGQAKHQYIEDEPKIDKASKSDDAAPTDSRVQIMSLKARPNSAAVNAALDFRRNHFFGSNVKRSTAMLPTTSKPKASV